MAVELDTVTAERAQRWLDMRRRGIGGSDLGHLFNIEGPYGGCRRRLWYDKTNVPPDHPKHETDVMLRGKMLEEAAAQQYTLDTGRVLLGKGRGRIHAEYPWARVNLDRIIRPVPEQPGRGVLEIKTQNSWMFRRTRRDGLSDGYLLQLQHAMWVTGTEWGAFMVLQPDTWMRAKWDVAADHEIHDAIRRLGEEFWPIVANGPAPEKLDASDARCLSCPWRRTCQGIDRLMAAAGLTTDEVREPVPRDDSFNELVQDYVSAREAIADLTDLQTRIKDAIKAKLGDAEAVECESGRIYLRKQVSKRLDVAALKQAEPDIYERYARPSETRPLRVYLTGGTRDDDAD